MKKTSLSFMITAGILGGIFTFSVSPHLADAFDLSGTLGAVIGGAQQYRQIDAYMDHINNTDDGRNEYFQALIKDLGVSDNDYYARLLMTLWDGLPKASVHLILLFITNPTYTF